MPIQYSVKYTPQHYTVVPGPTKAVPPYFVVNNQEGMPVCFAFNENIANTIVLGLELVHEKVTGIKGEGISEALDRLIRAARK